MTEDIPLADLPLFWQGRCNALRILDNSRDKSNDATLREADAYEICAGELRTALRSQPETATQYELRLFIQQFSSMLTNGVSDRIADALLSKFNITRKA